MLQGKQSTSGGIRQGSNALDTSDQLSNTPFSLSGMEKESSAKSEHSKVRNIKTSARGSP
jgi:hypothetical protein